MRGLILAAILAGLPSAMAHAEEYASRADAQALLNKAVDHYHAVGRDKAFQDFAVKDSAFFVRDLYVYCDRDGQPPVLSFHPIAKALVNKSIENVVDGNGRQYAVAMLRDALSAGTSQVDYAWSDPISKKIQPKTALAAKVSDDEVCAVGYYR